MTPTVSPTGIRTPQIPRQIRTARSPVLRGTLTTADLSTVLAKQLNFHTKFEEQRALSVYSYSHEPSVQILHRVCSANVFAEDVVMKQHVTIQPLV